MEEVNEMGLLAYNYDIEDPSGQIDDASSHDSTKNTKKEPLSPKGKTNVTNTKNKKNENKNNADNYNEASSESSSSSRSRNKLTQCQSFCVGIFYWIPIRSLCFFGSLALFILPFIDDKFGSPTFIEWLLSWYIQAFAILAMFIESPTWFLTKYVQLKVFFWARFLRRTSGRAFFYITVSIMTFAGIHDKVTITMFAGIYMVIVSMIMLLFSVLAAKQLQIMYSFMKYGGNIDGDVIDNDENINDENQLSQRLLNYYNQIDKDRTKKIGSQQLSSFAEQSLKRKLSNSERYTIQCYLDVSCKGHISPEDWVKQFMNSKKVKFL